MARKLKQVVFDTPEVRKLQENVSSVLDQLTSSPLADSVLIENIDVSASGIDVPHGLQRVPRGWYVVRRNNTVPVYDDPAGQRFPDKTLSLVSAGPVTVSLIVF